MPSPSAAHPYVAGVIDRIEQATTGQDRALRTWGDRLARRIHAGGILHVFGTGHSHVLAEELFGRAGGPTFVNPILDEALMLHAGVGKSSRAERLPGYARVVLDGHDLRPGDALLVSNSGRNAVPIEAALRARELGLATLAITSFAHSRAFPSRHDSGLLDVVDVAFDNAGEVGDAQLTLPGTEERFGPTSTVVGAVLAHTLLCIVIERLAAMGDTPPLLRSGNLDGSEEHNEARRARYLPRSRRCGDPGPSCPTETSQC